MLRTGSAAIGSAAALVDLVVGPALAAAGLPGDAVQLLRVPGRESAEALVTEPTKIPLVILRGSGESTRSLAARAALAGVKTLAHADGGGVLYVHPAADRALADKLVDDGLDRLGVCNRLNLLLVDKAIWDELVPGIVEQLAAREPKIAASLPPHEHPLGYEWALDDSNEATVTIAPADGELDAADIANRETSGLAATIVTEDAGRRRTVPQRVRGHRRVLERVDPAARRVQAARRPRDRHQRRPRARPARPGDLPRPLPPAVRGGTGRPDPGLMARPDGSDTWAERLAEDRAALTGGSRSQLLAGKLRERITEGVFRPGERLSEEALSEALERLPQHAARGVPPARPGGRAGARVRPRRLRPHADHRRRPRHLRDAPHPRTGRACATCRTRRPAPSTQIRLAVETAEEAAARSDWGGVGSANMRFHQAVAELAGSRRVREVVRRLLAELRLVFVVMDDLREFHEPYLKSNRELYETARGG